MNISDAMALITLDEYRFSVLLVTPKPLFLEWVSALSKKKGLPPYKYYEEENSTWVIPASEDVSEGGGIYDFVSSLKPRLLLAELSRFGGDEEDLGHPITEDTFDLFFTAKVRDEVSSIEGLA